MRNTFPRGHVVVAVAGLLVLGLVVLAAAGDQQRFSDWSAPVNLGPLVNSSVSDAGAFI